MSAVLKVDLAGLAANIAHVRATVAPAELMLVVKDDAYRHGIDAVVRRARAEGVRRFGSFDVRTGLRVLAAAPDARVFAWNMVAAELPAALEAGIELGIGEAELLEEVASAARAAGTPARVHLKIDTGLRRNGVRPEDWGGYVARAAALEQAGLLRVQGIWSHIAEASDEEDDAARRVFDAAVEQARGAGLRPAVRHLAASAASFARPEFRYDIVRVGAFCYGIAPAGGPYEDDLGIRPIGALQASVVAVADGVAMIDAGMLEGLPSTLGGRVEVGTPGGRRALLSVGDTSTVAGWPAAAIGDVVTVYGPGGAGESTATGLAETIGTIGEEIGLRISPLVPRVYAD